MEPVSALPSYCHALPLLSEASALEILSRGHPFVVGPTYVLDAGAHVAAIQGFGIAMQVFDTAGDCRGVFASWVAARTAVLGLVAEWEAGVDLTGFKCR